MKHLLVFIIFMMFGYCSAVPAERPDQIDSRNYCFENVNKARRAANLEEFKFDTEMFKEYLMDKKCLSNEEMSNAEGYRVEKRGEGDGVPKKMLQPGVGKFTCYDTKKCRGSGSDETFYFLENPKAEETGAISDKNGNAPNDESQKG